MRIGDLDGDGKREIICAGNGPAVRVPLLPDRKSVQVLGEREAWVVYPVDLDRDNADEVVILGPELGNPRATRAWLWRTIVK